VTTPPPPVVVHHQEVLFVHNRHQENPASNILQISNSSTFHVGDLQGNNALQSAKAWVISGFIVKKNISVCATQATFTLAEDKMKQLTTEEMFCPRHFTSVFIRTITK